MGFVSSATSKAQSMDNSSCCCTVEDKLAIRGREPQIGSLRSGTGLPYMTLGGMAIQTGRIPDDYSLEVVRLGPSLRRRIHRSDEPDPCRSLTWRRHESGCRRRIGIASLPPIVLVDVVPHADASGVARVQEFMRARPDGFESLEEMADEIARYQPHRRRPRNLETLMKNARRDSNGRFRWHFDPAFATKDLELDRRQERLDTALKAIDSPMLLVRGMLSDVLTDEGVASFQALRPDAECVTVSDAAHMVAGDQNDAFTEVVAEFLLRSRPSERAF